MNGTLEWTRIKELYAQSDTPACSTYRAKVPGGWLVAIWAAPDAAPRSSADTNKHTFGGGVAFVPDPTHGWQLEEHPTM